MKKILKIFLFGLVIAVLYTAINPEAVKAVYAKVYNFFTEFFSPENWNELIDKGVKGVNDAADEIKEETGIKPISEGDVTPLPENPFKYGADMIKEYLTTGTPAPESKD